MKSTKILTLATALALYSVVQAQTPIKSVDEKGNVTYSDKPAEGAVSTAVVPVSPAPSDEEVQAARDRARQTREQAEKAEADRKALEAKREAERAAARERKAANPEVVIIKEEGGYPAHYRNPPLITPRPPVISPGKPDHPAYQPENPINQPRPPVSIPVIRPR
jgi:hypothetical protein